MLPKVSSLPSLNAAKTSWRTSQSARGESARTDVSQHGRRRSLDAGGNSRPRSRPGSCVDLASLDALGANSASATPAEPICISRPVSPAPPSLWTVAESPSCTPFGSYTDDAFTKFVPLPSAIATPATPNNRSTSSAVTGAAQNSDVIETDVMVAAVAVTDENQETPRAAVSADDGVDVLIAACGDMDDDFAAPAPHAPSAMTIATAAPPPAPLPAAPRPAAIPSTHASSAASPFEIAAIAAPTPTVAATKPSPLQLPINPAPIATSAAAALATTKRSGSKKAAKADAARTPTSPVSLVFPPRATEVHIYHAHANFSYVQELLCNLAHVQHMFKGAAGSGSGSSASSAVAAARMLSRSLARAAQRVRASCLGPTLSTSASAHLSTTSTKANANHCTSVNGRVNLSAAASSPLPNGLAAASAVPLTPEVASERVVLSREALHTVAEFGWAELVTCDVEQAQRVGALDLEVHDLATGRVASYHRQAPGQPWVHVGVSAGSTSSSQVAAILGPTSPLAPLSRSSTGSGAFTPSPSCSAASSASQLALTPPSTPSTPSSASWSDAGAGVAGGVSMTVARFAQQLQDAGASVLAAAQLLQQWVDELRAASDLATAALTNASAGPSPSSATSSNALGVSFSNPAQLVTASV